MMEIFLWFFRKSPDSDLVLYRHMDKISVLISDLDKKIRNLKGKNEAKYWEMKWEEAISLYMEFEWHFHPQREKYENA